MGAVRLARLSEIPLRPAVGLRQAAAVVRAGEGFAAVAAGLYGRFDVFSCRTVVMVGLGKCGHADKSGQRGNQ